MIQSLSKLPRPKKTSSQTIQLLQVHQKRRKENGPLPDLKESSSTKNPPNLELIIHSLPTIRSLTNLSPMIELLEKACGKSPLGLRHSLLLLISQLEEQKPRVVNSQSGLLKAILHLMSHLLEKDLNKRSRRSCPLLTLMCETLTIKQQI